VLVAFRGFYGAAEADASDLSGKRHPSTKREETMKQIVASAVFALAFAATAAEPSTAADAISKDIAARVEAIPIQTISDEQFLKGDAYGRPTTIAAVLRVARGSGRLPLVILVPGSGGFNANLDVWDRQFRVGWVRIGVI
jgi:hypothetical protein